MADEDFYATLAELEDLCDGGSAPAPEVDAALRRLASTRPVEIDADPLKRLLTVCFRLAGLQEPPVKIDTGRQPSARQGIVYMIDSLIEDTVKDRGAFNRAFIERQAARDRARNRPPSKELFRHHIPRYSIPLTAREAGPLLAPFLAALERQLTTDPYGHLRIVWEALSHPLPPFEQVFRD